MAHQIDARDLGKGNDTARRVGSKGPQPDVIVRAVDRFGILSDLTAKYDENGARHQFGAPGQLRYDEIPEPEPSPSAIDRTWPQNR